MAEAEVLKVQKREGRGSHKARKMRAEGLVPAILYGHKEEAVSLAVPNEAIETMIRHGSQIVDIEIDGSQEKALVREIQWDYLGKEALHVDFGRVSAHEKIQLTVPLKLHGVSPGATAGGVLEQPLHVLEVECPVISVPDSIEVNINELEIGQSILVQDLNLGENVKALEEPDAIVVQVTEPREEEEPEEEGAEAAEPEVLGRKPEDEAGESDGG